MTTHNDIRTVVKKHHQALLELMTVIEQVKDATDEAHRLARAVWPTLQDYGLRDTHGNTWNGHGPVPPQHGRPEPWTDR